MTRRLILLIREEGNKPVAGRTHEDLPRSSSDAQLQTSNSQHEDGGLMDDSAQLAGQKDPCLLYTSPSPRD